MVALGSGRSLSSGQKFLRRYGTGCEQGHQPCPVDRLVQPTHWCFAHLGGREKPGLASAHRAFEAAWPLISPAVPYLRADLGRAPEAIRTERPNASDSGSCGAEYADRYGFAQGATKARVRTLGERALRMGSLFSRLRVTSACPQRTADSSRGSETVTSARGRVTVTVVPRPTSLVRVSVPECACTMLWQIASPSPVPPREP